MFLSPCVHKKKDPRNGQCYVPNSMPRPLMCKIPKLPLKEESPECNGNVKHHTPLGKETLKLYVLNKSNHQEKESYCEQQQAREGIRGVN